MGRYDPSLLAGFLTFSRGKMIAKSQIPGHFPELKDWLKMARSSAFPCGPSAFRNEEGMSSGPAAPFLHIAWIACSSSYIEKSWHELTAGPTLRERSSFLSLRFVALPFFENLWRLTLA